MQTAPRDPRPKIIATLYGLYALFFAYLALRVHWSDSELWAMTLAKTLFSAENPSIDYKIVFNLLLKIIYFLPLDNLEHVHVTRLIFATIGLGVVYFSARSFHLIAPKARDTFFFVLFLGTSTLFLSQGFKIRSDLLGCLLQFAGVFYFLNLKSKKSSTAPLSYREVAGAFILNILLLLTTPKAIYAFAVNAIFIAAFLFNNPPKWLKRYLTLVFLAPLLIFCVIALIWVREFSTALDFFIASYKESYQHPAFWTVEAFEFVLNTVLRHPHIFILIIFGIFFWRKNKEAPLLPPLLATLASLGIVVLHNDRLPFFIVTQMIFPIFFAGLAFAHLQVRWARILLCTFAVVNALDFSSAMLNEANNDVQIETQNKIQSYLHQHNHPTYYDATGVLPRENKLYVFPAPQHLGNDIEVLGLLNRPDLSVVFWGNRLFNYFQPFNIKLEEKFFIQASPGMFVRSYVVRSTHKVDASEWETLCKSLGHPGKVFIYEGESFLSMRRLNSQEASCFSTPPVYKSEAPFVGFSAFEPIDFKEGLSFSNIFDHKAYY